uniref:Uncharacterized protein n=1 Tax=viral metagenome TaxID=1070528 RepID=A0A6H1ZA16_9ZZZZ
MKITFIIRDLKGDRSPEDRAAISLGTSMMGDQFEKFLTGDEHTVFSACLPVGLELDIGIVDGELRRPFILEVHHFGPDGDEIKPDQMGAALTPNPPIG